MGGKCRSKWIFGWMDSSSSCCRSILMTRSLYSRRVNESISGARHKGSATECEWAFKLRLEHMHIGSHGLQQCQEITKSSKEKSATPSRGLQAGSNWQLGPSWAGQEGPNACLTQPDMPITSDLQRQLVWQLLLCFVFWGSRAEWRRSPMTH